jgi:hypothetical protein
VHVVVTSVDPEAPWVDTTGIDDYMHGLIQFGQALLPGTSHVNSAIGDDTRALLQVTSRANFGPDAPQMTLHGARLYRLDENQQITEEQVIFFVTPECARRAWRARPASRDRALLCSCRATSRPAVEMPALRGQEGPLSATAKRFCSA